MAAKKADKRWWQANEPADTSRVPAEKAAAPELAVKEGFIRPPGESQKLPKQKAPKADKPVYAKIAKLGWSLDHEQEPQHVVPEFHGKTESNEAYDIPGKYVAYKKIDTSFISQYGESPEQLLERVQAWEAEQKVSGGVGAS